MLSLTTAFILNNIWTLLLGVAFIVNHIQRKDAKPLYWVSLILVAGFALPGILYAQVIVKIQPLLPVYYLYWAVVNAAIVAAIVILIKVKKWPMYRPVKVVIGCLMVDVLFNVLLHVDRNILALNGADMPNMAKTSAWALWTLRNWASNVNNSIILTSMLLPFTYSLKGFKGVFKQLLNVVDIRQYRSSNKVEQRFNTIDRMIDLATPAAARSARQYLVAAKELSYRADETNADFTAGINLLLDAAAHASLQTSIEANTHLATSR